MKSFFLLSIFILSLISPRLSGQHEPPRLYPPLQLLPDTTTIYLRSYLGELKAGAVTLPIGLSDRSSMVDTLMLTGRPRQALSVMTIETSVGEQQLLLLDHKVSAKQNASGDLNSPGGYRLEVQDSSIQIWSTGGPVNYLVFFNNQLLSLPCKKRMPPDCRIAIPARARELKRSFIRIYSWHRHQLGRQMLIPLEYGEVIQDPEKLNRLDWPGSVILAHPYKNLPALDKELYDKQVKSRGINSLAIGPQVSGEHDNMPSGEEWQGLLSNAHISGINIMLECAGQPELESPLYGAYRGYWYDGYLNCHTLRVGYATHPSGDFISDNIFYAQTDSGYHHQISAALCADTDRAKALSEALQSRIADYGEHHLLLNRIGFNEPSCPLIDSNASAIKSALLLAAFQFASPGLPYLTNNVTELPGQASCEQQILRLAQLRRSKLCLMYGSTSITVPKPGILLISRRYFDQEVIAMFNLSRHPQTISREGTTSQYQALCGHFDVSLSEDASQSSFTMPPMTYEYFQYTSHQQ